jgi:hypothetical protein
MKKLFCAVLFCTSFFSYAMDPRDTDDRAYRSDDVIRRGSSDLKVKILQTANASARRSSSPITRSKRLDHDNDNGAKSPRLDQPAK